MSVCQVLAVCLLLGTAANGQGTRAGPDEILKAPRWEIAPEVFYFRYQEPGVMKDTGVFYGVAGSYVRYRQNKLFRAEGEFAFGLVDYVGSLDDETGTPYTMEGSRDYLFQLRLLWGRMWQGGGWDNQFYAGLGYRGLNDDSTQDPAGYDRQANYLYLPLGLKGYYPLAGPWQIGLGGEFDLLLVGLQMSGMSDGGVMTNVQWPGIGARAAVELRHRTRSLDLAIAPFVQYWWIAESSSSYYDGYDWYEPRNNTLQYGLSLIWRF